MINTRSMQAYLTLAFALLKRIIVMAVVPFDRRRGAGTWLGTLARESLARTPADAWGYLAATSRCIGCGLCDITDPTGDLSGAVMAAARRPQDAPLALAEAERLRGLAVQISRVCPVRLPAAVVAQLIRDNVAELPGPGERS